MRADIGHVEQIVKAVYYTGAGEEKREDMSRFTVGETHAVSYAAPGYGQRVWLVTLIDAETGVWGRVLSDTCAISDDPDA